MKILRTLPFVLSSLFVMWGSAVGASRGLLWVLALFCTLIAVVVSLFGHLQIPTSWGAWEARERPRARKRRRMIIGGSLAVTISVTTLHWPLRACFWMSRPALERVAQQVQHGTIETPQHVGAFTIVSAKFEDGQIVLRMDDNVLIRHAPGKEVRWFNRETTRLDDEWSLYIEM